MEKSIPRPEGYMENPYKGKDGREYHTHEDLQAANAEVKRQLFPQKVRSALISGLVALSLGACEPTIKEVRDMNQDGVNDIRISTGTCRSCLDYIFLGRDSTYERLRQSSDERYKFFAEDGTIYFINESGNLQKIKKEVKK